MDAYSASSVSSAEVHSDRGYAVCFDELVQPEFRRESIVLTGWVCHEEGQFAYFDRCVLLDAYGRQVMSMPIGTDELSQYPRGGLPDAGLVLTQAATDDADFVLHLDLSDAALLDGSIYELQLYSANVTGEDWAMVSAKVLINSAAPAVEEDVLARIIEQWKPPEPTPEPTMSAEGES